MTDRRSSEVANADRKPGQPQDREENERLQPDDDGPIKRHGDALQTGSGTRHGVTEADERPET